MRPLLIPFGVVLLCLIGCGERTGPTQRESRSVEKDAAKSLRAELKMGAGELRVAGGSSNWLQGNFAYNVPGGKPNIRYAASGDRADLTVGQPESGSHIGNTTNQW